MERGDFGLGQRDHLGTWVEGELAHRWALAAARLQSDDPYTVEFVVQDVRQTASARRPFDDYCGDLSGRFIDTGSLMEFASGRRMNKLHDIVRQLLAEQRPEGHFGHRVGLIATDHGAAWGNGRLLDGLLTHSDCLEVDQRHAVDDAIVRLALAIVDQTPAWTRWWAVPQNRQGKFALDMLSCLLPLVEVYRRTQGAPFLEAARALAEMVPTSDGFHTHGYLLALRGLLELGSITGERSELGRVLAAWAELRDSFMLPNGALYESLKEPHDVSAEGCAVADWIMLNLRLGEITGQPHHLDLAEVALRNALFHMQRPSGHFGCETIVRDPSVLAFDFAPEAWWCCTFHGMRALHAFRQHLYATSERALIVNFFAPSGARINIQDSDVRVSQHTAYPRDGAVAIEVVTSQPTQFGLHIRIPGFATVDDLSVGGEDWPARVERGYLVIDTQWTGKTVVQLTVGLGVNVRSSAGDYLRYGSNSTDDEPFGLGRAVSLFWGPLLLAADGRNNEVNDLIRIRRIEIRHRGNRFVIAEDHALRFRARAHGLDTFHTDVILTPLGDQTFYDRDESTLIMFPEAEFLEVGSDWTERKG